MDRYYTVMVIPEQKKQVISFRIPRPLFRFLSCVAALILITLIVLAYDYKQVLNQIYENRYLSVENRKLRDQLNIFQMKINTLSNDIQRIHIFEKKLRIITGIESMGRPLQDLPVDSEQPLLSPDQGPMAPAGSPNPQDTSSGQQGIPTTQSRPSGLFRLNLQEKSKNFAMLDQLHYKKMAEEFGLSSQLDATKSWNDLIKRTALLAQQFALFDDRYSQLRDVVKRLETEIHEIDQYLLDKESFMKSTPTLIPTRGWITSYYGPRTSPYSGRLKMHEGLDIGAQIGTGILAPADGIVVYSGHKPGFGNFVQLDHGYGIETIYGHAQTLKVRNGQKVQRGHLIAQVGNTGLSTGPHLHYEVRVNGIAVDPLYFILD